MNLGETERELQVEPLQWPQQMPQESAPAREDVPATAPVEATPARKE